MRDLCIEPSDAPDTLAVIGEILGDAGVNIEGLCLVTHEGRAVIHLVVEDAVTARRVLERSAIGVMEVSDVFVFHKDEKQVTGKPGSFGAICRKLAEHGLRIRFGYPAENNRFVFGVSDVVKARMVLGQVE
jgi:hypothetical protein